MSLVEQVDGVLVQVNCSQTRYINPQIMLKVSAEQHGNIVKNVISPCTNYEILVDLYECELPLSITIHWILAMEGKIHDNCVINSITQTLRCPGNIYRTLPLKRPC